MMEQKRKILPLIIIAAAILAYSSSFSGVFLLDDHVVITGNRDIGSFVPVSLSARMLVDFTFKLNYLIGGFKAADYHLVNLLIHIVTGLFLYGIIRRTLLLQYFAGRYLHASSIIACVCSCIWIIHPLVTQSITYICQRYESMMGLFFLSSVYCFVRACTSEHKRLWFDLSILACILGMGTKEVIAVAPFVIIIYDYVFLSDSIKDLVRKRWKVHLCLFSTIGILVCLLLCSLAKEMEISSRFVHISPLIYLANQCKVVLYYLWLSVFPRDLCFDYAWIPSEDVLSLMPYILITSTLFVVAVAATYFRKSAGFLGLSFFAVLAPTSSVVPVADLIVEHRMYLPLISVVVLLVVGSCRLTKATAGDSLHMIHIWCSIWSLIAIVFIFLTYMRNIEYRSEEAIWRDVMRKQPCNYRAGNDLAVALSETGKFDEAMQVYDKVLSAIPEAVIAELESGKIVVRDVFVKSSPEYQYFVANANKALLISTREGRRDEAIGFYIKALRVAPDNQNVREKIKHVLRQKKVPETCLDDEIHAILMNKKQK